MSRSRPGAALAPFAALIAGAAVLALPGLGHAETPAAVPAAAAKPVAAAQPVASKPAAAKPAPAQPAAAPAPAIQPAAASKPADLAIKPVVRTASAQPAAVRARNTVRPAQGPVEPGELHVDLSSAGSAARTLNVPSGKSAMVDLPSDVRDVLVTNPAVADAVLRTRRRISVLGIAPGSTDVVFFDEAGKRILTLDIQVNKDASAPAEAMAKLLPDSKVRVAAASDSLVLNGQVSSAAEADKAVRLAQRFVAKPDQVVNQMTITAKEQVMLKVRVVEIQRTIIKQLGFNTNLIWQKVTNSNAYGFALANAPTFGVNGALLGGGKASGNYTDKTTDANAAVEAFERVGLVRTLAEPNLTAISGESAKFLAGGEYPVPVGQDNNGRVTVEFKPYGIGLNFTPIVLSEGRISLRIATEVSELSTDGGFTMGTGSAATLTIPALKLRRTETTVELPSGGAMMIAGLLQQQTKQDIDKVPGLANTPVLGALFRSRDYLSGETELAIIVEPYVVQATSPDKLQTPVDGLELVNDVAADLLGRINKTSNVPPAAVAGKSLQGPYGYVIE